MFVRVLIGIAILGHGLIHIGFVAPGPDDPNYPFKLDESWLFPETVRRGVGTALAIITIVAFAALALAWWGVPGLDSLWQPLVIVGSLASLVLLVAFWHSYIVVGVVIDVGLLVLTFANSGWWESLQQ